jgi:hypothetical protein
MVGPEIRSSLELDLVILSASGKFQLILLIFSMMKFGISKILSTMSVKVEAVSFIGKVYLEGMNDLSFFLIITLFKVYDSIFQFSLK